MITVANILAQYPGINQDNLPAALKQAEFEFISENIDLYDEDETIKKYIDTFVQKINEVLSKQGSKTKAAAKTGKQVKVAARETPVETKKVTRHIEKKSNCVAPGNIAKVGLEVSFIKRYIGLQGKIRDKQQILSFINSLQKAIVERRIRKTATHATEIQHIQAELIKCHKEMGNTATITIAPGTLESYSAIAGSERVQPAVSYMKQFISLHGKADVKKRAKSLYNRIEKAINRGDISYSDDRYDEVHQMQVSLINYLQDRDTHIQISQNALNGLRGLTTSPDGCLLGTGTHPQELVSSTTLPGMQFETIGLRGKYHDLIGDPSVGFTAMVHGLPKSGKSTLCIGLASHLARHHGQVLYVAVEEGVGYTLKEKFERLDAIHPNLIIAEKLPADLTQWDFVFIDSVSKAGYSNADLAKLHQQFPRTAFINIFHSTKDGKFRGGQEFAHEVDCIINVDENGMATANGRFGAGAKMSTFGD